MTKKVTPIKYEQIDLLSRWNICLKIAMLLYRGKKSDSYLKSEFKKIENDFLANQ